MVEGSEGPLPLLDCQNSLKKRRPPRKSYGIAGKWGYVVDERRAAPPAYGQRVWSNCYRGPFVLALAALRSD